MYYVRPCAGYYELREFIDKANRERFEIIAVTEVVHSDNSHYTVIYRRW